jgi:hypothetical protein
MRANRGWWLAIPGILIGASSPADAVDDADEFLALIEYLGDEEMVSDEWNGYLDSLPERPEDASPLVTRPVAADEPRS